MFCRLLAIAMQSSPHCGILRGVPRRFVESPEHLPKAHQPTKGSHVAVHTNPQKSTNSGQRGQPAVTRESCNVVSRRADPESFALRTEEARGEDLQRCSVQEFATTSFASRVWLNCLTGAGSRLELLNAEQGAQEACSGCRGRQTIDRRFPCSVFSVQFPGGRAESRLLPFS